MEKSFFITQLKNDLITYEYIWKIATGQEDDYPTGCLLDYNYFTILYKMIATDWSRQQALDADWKPIQQINFIASLGQAGHTAMYFIIEEVKETVLYFSEETVRVF